MQFLRDARWLVKTDIQNRDSRVSRLKTCRDSGFREENLGQSLQIGTVGHSASAVCSDEGLTLETSAKHNIPQATNVPYQPC